MPIYQYRDTVTDEVFEVFQSMKDDSLTVHPENGHPVVKVFTVPNVQTDDTRTVGSIAEKNTRDMIRKGDPRVKTKKDPNPWWRKDKDKPLNTAGWTKKQKSKYIAEGKKP